MNTTMQTPVSPTVTWESLTAANPSLNSWLRDAEQAGTAQAQGKMSGWLLWCVTSPHFRNDVSHALAPTASAAEFQAAKRFVFDRLETVFRRAERNAQGRPQTAGRRAG